MKKILLICCLFLGIAAVSHAQGNARRFNPEDRAKRLQTQFKLSDEQTAKIAGIYKEQGAKLDSLRNTGGGRDQYRPLMDATNTKVKAVLTPEQAAAFEKWQTERRGRMRRGGDGGATTAPPPPAPQQ
ncbi:hypothetical protein DJ568_08730 [Mucilaginibacter hurinus]|uniref:DUF4890 domain-containing protein n=1 Tax=Mucilaginibacter hurinus TaxID=2201324 RepID=A0A367GP79_9SPHI|nr:hypothetical protein [Mucilaginibacter hurinus]RCH55259.1 hypothetical protein DJ568_08730 [Mucilaginibacter hurinus]